MLIPACDRISPPKDSEYEPLDQGHIELLQALILHLPSDRLGGPLEPGYPQTLLALQREAASLFRSWSLSRFDTSGKVENVQLIEFFRGRTAIIRNWGDTNQVLSWLEDLFAPEDRKLVGRFGVSFTRLIRCIRMLLDLLQHRLNVRRDSLRPVLNATTKEKMVSRYLKIEDRSESAKGEGYTKMMELAADRDQLQAIIFTHFDLDLWKVFAFNLDDFDSEFSDSEKAGLREIFDRWSLEPESLASQNLDHIFMDNPVWQAPLIKLTTDEYYWPLIHVFQSFGLEMLADLLVKPERKTFEGITKPNFAETKVEQLFEEAFPGAAIFANTRYSLGDTEFENDCCVIIDAYCFAIEVKSGKLRSSAKRGSALSLEEGLDLLIGEGATQANRFIAALEEAIPLRDERKRSRTIDISRVRHFIPMVVTFEHLGEVAANKNALIEAEFLREDTMNTLCLCLPDLERVLQVLPSMSQRLHYLVRRSSIERHFKFRGDELDLLVFYLKTGFAIGEAEFEQEKPIMFGGLSTELDSYLMDTTGEVARPSRFLTPRWKSILEQIESRGFPNWTEAALILLGIDQEGMEGLEESLTRMALF